jgi:hypothetical protein
MIALLLVYATDQADVDTKDEIHRGKIYYIQLLAILINVRILNIS